MSPDKEIRELFRTMNREQRFCELWEQKQDELAQGIERHGRSQLGHLAQLNKDRESKWVEYHWRRDNRLCVLCQASLRPEDGSTCPLCRKQRREYKRAARAEARYGMPPRRRGRPPKVRSEEVA